jgi:3-oxoadipate enol-lactonase
MWEPQLVLAEQGWRIVAPHYRGMDGGDGDPPAASIDDYAGDVIDLLDALHIEDAVVAGLSIGGYVAFALLRHAARYVRALVLADTRSQADTPEGVEGRKRMIALVRDKGASAIADEMVPKLRGETTRQKQPQVVSRVRSLILPSSTAGIAGGLNVLMTRPDSTPLLSSIHVPTLILVGAEDTVTPPAMSEEMHRAIHGSTLEIIPEAGHLSNLEQPAAFNAELGHFLEHKI